jgi:polyphosphate kinase
MIGYNSVRMDKRSRTRLQFINRELSWLEFNQRVLDQALDPSTPLLERLKFFCISHSNLDEFFEVRVAGIKQQIEAEVGERGIDGMTPRETFRAIRERTSQMVDDQYRCWRKKLLPDLQRHGIAFLNFDDLSPEQLAWVQEYYFAEIRPVLTPLAIDPAHPFPQLLNKSLNIIVRLEVSMSGRPLRHLAVVQVPRVLPRLVQLPGGKREREYLFLGHLVGHFLPDLFPGTKIIGYWHFRLTRNSELYIDEEEAANLLKAVENELHNRRKGDAVRLEIDFECPPEIRTALLGTFRLTDDDVYLIDGPLSPTQLMAIYEGDYLPELRDPPFTGVTPPLLDDGADLFEVIRQHDILLHHPYESFETIVQFLEQAAADPNVLAIKQTLYRTGGDRRIVGALMDAVRNGKQVTAVVELRARFDEANNILWARQLEQAGVHVVYGLVGFKIHAKLCLVVRREEHGIQRYVHLGTGNYNPTTAKIYTDLSLLTSKHDYGEDVTNLFNLLTGICQFQKLRKLVVAPFELHQRIVDLISRESANARKGLPARIIAKMNSLVDERVIEALYEASEAGVKIDLVVRGICCLRPGIPGASDNIVVHSIVDRFLEHSRMFYFENACQPEVFVSSADWMPRNFFRRIEVAFPIEDGKIRERIVEEILGTTLADNSKGRLLNRSAHYTKVPVTKGADPVRSQFKFISIAQAEKAENSAPQRRQAVKLAPKPASVA